MCPSCDTWTAGSLRRFAAPRLTATMNCSAVYNFYCGARAVHQASFFSLAASSCHRCSSRKSFQKFSPFPSGDMGHKRVKGTESSSAAADDAGMKKVDGDWGKSSVKAAELDSLRQQGLLPPESTATTRAPGKDTIPAPRNGERVCFVEFLPRGFGFPLHDFVRGLLYAYGIQIHDLTPNSILSITSFIVLCECFLGIAPHWALWKSLFQVRRMVGKSKETYPVGGFGIQLRGDTVFFHMKKSDSVQNWRKKWFYVKWNQTGLPDFAADRPLKKTKAWSHPLSAEEKESIKPLTSLLRGLLKSMGREAGGIQLIAMFLRLRVQPLQQRPLPMWEMAVDPAVDDAQVAIKVRNITSLRVADPCNLTCPVTPFSSTNPIPEVSV